MARTITHKLENDETSPAMFGEKEHLEVAQNKTFTQTIFESLTEREASVGEVKLLDLILNLSFDHGPNSPSAIKTIETTKEGEGMGKAVGEGVEEINERHGGAGEPLMKALYQIKNGEITAKDYVVEMIAKGERIPGLGHRVYKQSLPSKDGKEIDPRAQLIFEKAQRFGIEREFIIRIKEIRDEYYKQNGKYLTVNIDGAIAAILCGFGLKPEVGIAVFIIARALGLAGHYINTKNS